MIVNNNNDSHIDRPGSKAARTKAGYELYSSESDDLRRPNRRGHPDAGGPPVTTLVEEWMATQGMCIFSLSVTQSVD